MWPIKHDKFNGVSIVTLGCCSVRVSGRAIDSVPANFFKIACLLLLSTTQSISRAALRPMLCSNEADPARAAASVRQSLARIRAFQSAYGFQLIAANPHTVYLLDDPSVDWDLRVVLDQNTDGLHAARRYGGDLLSGLGRCAPDFEDWLIAHRETLRTRVIANLEAALGELGGHEKSSCALRLLELDRSNTVAYGVLMQQAAAQGNAIRVRQLFAQCDRYLREDFGVSPPAAMRRLLDDWGLSA